MSRRVSIGVAGLIVIVTAGAAVGLALLVTSGSGDAPGGGVERLISKAALSPSLPTYEPGSFWPKLPAKPPPEEPESGESEPTIDYTPEPEPIVTEPTGEGGGSRPYGITFGK